MTASNARTRITRLVTTHAIKRNAYEALVGDPATTFAGLKPTEEGATYDMWSGYAVAQSYSGDLIRYKNSAVVTGQLLRVSTSSAPLISSAVALLCC